MGNTAQSHEGIGLRLLFPIVSIVKLIDVWREAKNSCISVGNERIHIEDWPDTQIDVHKISGDNCIMPIREMKSLPFGMQGDNCPYDMANSLFYVIYDVERKCRSRIWCLNLKNTRIMHLVDQQSQLLVRGRLLESLKANSWKVGDEVRELALKILGLFGNGCATI